MTAPIAGAYSLFEALPHLLEVVDLTVVRDDPALICRRHRLRAGLGKIDDREAPVPECDAGLGVDKRPLAVRPAMGNRPGHIADQGFAGDRIEARASVNKSGNPAHDRSPFEY